MEILKAGAVVSIHRTVHTGTVVAVRVSADGSRVDYLVEYQDHDGDVQLRYFSAEEVKAQ